MNRLPAALNLALLMGALWIGSLPGASATDDAALQQQLSNGVIATVAEWVPVVILFVLLCCALNALGLAPWCEDC